MSGQEYFKKGLSDFTYEAASGGAVRHLADLGYSVRQIMERLDFPAPYERVQKTVWEHLADTGVLLFEEPGSGKQREKAAYVRDYDKYGRTSFRRISLPAESSAAACRKELHYSEEKNGKIAAYLAAKCAENGIENAYISCGFGLCISSAPDRFRKALQKLDESQRDYITGLPWERKICYHRLNPRMQEITARLYQGGGYEGTCFFVKTGEKVVISSG